MFSRHQAIPLLVTTKTGGPLVGLSDVIVDIVETGSTLRENGLEVLEEVCGLSARMIVNPVAMQMERTRIQELVLSLRRKLNS